MHYLIFFVSLILIGLGVGRVGYIFKFPSTLTTILGGLAGFLFAYYFL